MPAEDHGLLLNRPDWFQETPGFLLDALIGAGERYNSFEKCRFCGCVRVTATSMTTGCCDGERMRYRFEKVLKLLKEDTPLEEWLTDECELAREIGAWLKRRVECQKTKK